MKCAECGRENLDDAKFCSYCATPLINDPEITDTGSALRKIYNDFGYERVFEDHRYITSALGDFVPDSEMISNSIEMAYRAGLGKVYEAQIRKGGKPNEAFYKHVKEVITEDAGLSEKRANQIIGYFDEMLGWGTRESSDIATESESVIEPVEPEKPAPVVITKSGPELAEPESEEHVMSEPEDEVLAALADEGISPFKSVSFATPEPEHVETISEEEPIRSIPQEQALKELQPEEGVVDAEPFKKTESPFKTIEENNSKKSADQLERKRQEDKERVAIEKTVKKRKRTAAIVLSIIAFCVAVVIVLLTVIIPGYKNRIVSLSEAKKGSHVIFGSYEQDNNTSNGKEDIEWIVLAREDDQILVISRYALDCQKYNTSSQFDGGTWEKCSLRKWLNGTFLDNAFSLEERVKISTVIINADKNPNYDTNPGNATTDQVFLLSITEANKFFSSDSVRECQGTDYCYAKGASKFSYGNCWWLLRSPGYDSSHAAYVNDFGCVLNYGYFITYDYFAVRPAMWINVGS